MVQLNTTYDSSIHQKVFVLKGDEAYARTTDTIATLITDFGDFDNHISYCHVGLEIQVLRELGNSNLQIYCDDEHLYTIPWSNDHMGEIIDSDWNEKGVYWENGKLLIGKYSLNPLVNTGLYLLYDVEHKIEVRYDPNNYCLGSSAKPIVFTVPTPDVFASTLTLNPLTTRFAPDDEVDMKLSFECDNQTTTAKSVRIYDNDVLVETVEVTQDIFTMLELGVLSTGLHTIKAVFEGDDEAYASETSLDISVGYKITNLQYPSYVIVGDDGSLSCNVLDYFNEPYVGLGVSVAEYNNGSWSSISSTGQTNSQGFININSVQYSEKEFAVTIDGWYDEKHRTNIINPTNVNVAFNDPIVDRPLFDNNIWGSADSPITATVYGDNHPIGGMPLTITIKNPFFEQTDSGMTDLAGNWYSSYGSNYAGKLTVTVSVNGTDVSNSASFIIPEHWWSNSENKQVGNFIKGEGITVSKESRGFKLQSINGVSNPSLRFPFNPNTNDPNNPQFPVEGIYLIDFDVVYAIGNDKMYIGSTLVNTSNWSGNHIQIVNNCTTGTSTIYVNGSQSTTITSDKYFYMGMYYGGAIMVINNLVIARSE